MPSSASAATRTIFCLLPVVIGPSAGAPPATGAVRISGFVPPACSTDGSICTNRCRTCSSVCRMGQHENNGGNSELPSRRKYNKKRTPNYGGNDAQGRRRRSPRQDGGDQGRRNTNRNTSWSRAPRYKSEIDSALEIADADAYEASIDSFLGGEYSQPFAEDAAAPHPGLTPSETLDCALRSLRRMDEPFESHGAAVFMRFCVPLTNSERWGLHLSSDLDPWKTILRGALSPNMLARQLRASSSFASLLDWKRLDVSDGFAIPSDRLELGVGATLAFVNAALYFEDGEPNIVQFTLRKIGGAWLIDDAVVSKRDWFVSQEDAGD
jgi:hypothetical protein